MFYAPQYISVTDSNIYMCVYILENYFKNQLFYFTVCLCSANNN